MKELGEASLSANEVRILRLIEKERKLSAWELSYRSPVGMRETQAIVEYLVRRKLIVRKVGAEVSLQIAK